MNVSVAHRLPCRAAGLVLIALPMLLGACASPPPAAPKAAAPQVLVCPPPAPVPVVTPASDPSADLLAYQQSLRTLSRADLQKELAAIDVQPPSSSAMLKKAMVLATVRGNGDLARAQQLAETAARASDAEAAAVRPLAQLLATTYADARRQSEQTDRLTQQVQAQQRRIEQLDNMLESLKAIERKLSTRPGGAASGGK